MDISDLAKQSGVLPGVMSDDTEKAIMSWPWDMRSDAGSRGRPREGMAINPYALAAWLRGK